MSHCGDIRRLQRGSQNRGALRISRGMLGHDKEIMGIPQGLCRDETEKLLLFQQSSQEVRCVPAVRCRKTHKDPQPQLDHSCSRSLATLVSILVRDGRNGGVLKLEVPFWGFPIIRITVSWGL